MPRDECHETEEGTIRCPTASAGSTLELSVSGASVLRRFIGSKGEPLAVNGNWVVISAQDALSYYNWPQFREWFNRHGFTAAALREQDRVERAAKNNWKSKLRR